MDSVRIAIIGTGSMGRQYAKLLAANQAESLRLTAVVCRHEPARQWAAKTLPADVWAAPDADTLYTRADTFDAVLIATPHSTHPALAMQAFAHGKHVLCDKPSANALGPALEMNRAAAESGLTFGMIFHQRLYPQYIRLRELVQSGALGRITRVRLENSRYFRTQVYHDSSPWRSSWGGEGGGVLINQGQHLLDIWQWIFGMPQSVYALIPFGKYNNFLVDDESTLLMEYPDARTAVFTISRGEGTFTEQLEVVGTKGTALLEENTLTLRCYDCDTDDYRRTAACIEREQLHETVTREVIPYDPMPYTPLLDNFGRAVLYGEPLIAPGCEGANALQLADAAYLSAWLGRKMTLPIDADLFSRELAKHIDEERHAQH